MHDFAQHRDFWEQNRADSPEGDCAFEDEDIHDKQSDQFFHRSNCLQKSSSLGIMVTLSRAEL